MSYNELINTYNKSVYSKTVLSEQEELELANKVKAGDVEARNEFILRNVKLVHSIVTSRVQNTGFKFGSLEIEDLLQEGMIGLMKAVDKFNPEIGKFSTYATWWINRVVEQAMQREGNILKIPEHTLDLVIVVSSVREELRTKLEKEPTEEEIVRVMRSGIGVKTVRKALKILDRLGVVSLDTTLTANSTDGTNVTFGDCLVDESADSPETYAEKKSEEDRLTAAIETLEPREKYVILMRYGLCGYQEMTLDKISEELFAIGITNKDGKKITKEGIRLIQIKAEANLRKILA